MASNTLTTTNAYQAVLTVDLKKSSVIPAPTIALSIYEGDLSADGATLTGVNDIKFKVQSAPIDAEALYEDLTSEQTLTAGTKTYEYLLVQERFVRVVVKSAVNDAHGKATVISSN